MINSVKASQKKQTNYLSSDRLRNEKGYNILQLKSHLIDEGMLQNIHMEQLITEFSKVIKAEPNLLQANGDVTVIGDIHGQYYDFMKILNKLENLQEKPKGSLLFLGDYVDRGANSIEVMTLIMALKVNYPKNIYLLRGNHQSRCMTGLYNFMQETTEKYNQDIYQRFMVAFNYLPIACLVNKTIFCVHGGLSASLSKIQEINQIKRFDEIPFAGVFCDLIWSDPVGDENRSKTQETAFNESRQCSIYYGRSLTNRFLQENSLKTIVRAHEVFPQGFKRYCWGKQKSADFPSVITVFSAPNYCGVYGNKGAILKIQNNLYKIKQYKQQVNHKLFRYFQAVEWSIPLISDVLNKFSKLMIQSLFRICIKPKFPQYTKVTTSDKLKFLLQYIQTETNIESKLDDRLLELKSIVSKEEDSQVKKNKNGIFDRSQEYFLKEHQRPDSFRLEQDRPLIKTKRKI